MFIAEFGSGQVFLSMLWFFLFMMWIWLVITVFTDIFRSPDLSGWSKALWSVLVIVLPYLGVFVYVIARGHKMTEHAMDQQRFQQEMYRNHSYDAAARPPSDADKLAQLASLRAQGVIDDAEYSRMKAKVVAA